MATLTDAVPQEGAPPASHLAAEAVEALVAAVVLAQAVVPPAAALPGAMEDALVYSSGGRGGGGGGGEDRSDGGDHAGAGSGWLGPVDACRVQGVLLLDPVRFLGACQTCLRPFAPSPPL
jgi:hypothetical protein